MSTIHWCLLFKSWEYPQLWIIVCNMCNTCNTAIHDQGELASQHDWPHFRLLYEAIYQGLRKIVKRWQPSYWTRDNKAYNTSTHGNDHFGASGEKSKICRHCVIRMPLHRQIPTVRLYRLLLAIFQGNAHHVACLSWVDAQAKYQNYTMILKIGTKNAAIEAKPHQYLLNFGVSPICQNMETQISNVDEYLVQLLKKATNCKTMIQLRSWMYHQIYHNMRMV